MVNVKPPSKHGLERKFKPWRRGKSEKSNKRSSLKQQLRGVERLLKKVSPEDDGRRQELESKIKQLKQEIDEKQKVLLEKKNAEKAHGQRFLDRQRLTRQEKQARKIKDKSEREAQLYKIALDQVYVAYHPTDVKYMPLFRKGNRVVDNSRQLYRRAITRRRILKTLTDEKKGSSWVSKDQYERLPSEEWTIQDEERVFGGSISREGVKEARKKAQQQAANDSRFTIAPQHDAVLQMADEIEAKLDEGDDIVAEVGDSSSHEESLSSDSLSDRKSKDEDAARLKAKDDSEDSSAESESDDDDELLDPMSKKAVQGGKIPKTATMHRRPGVSSESSESDSSDDSSDEERAGAQDMSKKTEGRGKNEDSESSSSSSDSSDDDIDYARNRNGSRHGDEAEQEEEQDDFLMDAKDDEEDHNVFSMTLKKVPALGDARGDKSKGWETQRQRPGQFKKRRIRR